MVTQNGKKILGLLGIIVLGLSILTIIPFQLIVLQIQQLQWLCDNQQLVKLAFIPIIVLFISLWPCILKYKGLRTRKFVTTVTLKMSYFPMVCYIISILVYAFGSLAVSYSLDSLKGNYIAIVILSLIICSYLVFFVFGKWLQNLNKKSNIIFDCLFVLYYLAVIFGVYYCFNKMASSNVIEYQNSLLMVIIISFFLILYFVFVLKSLWQKSKYKVVLGKKEQFTEIERLAFIREEETEALTNLFQEYYQKSSGIFLIGLDKNKETGGQ